MVFFLEFPGNKRISKVNTKASDTLASIRTTSPITITESTKLEVRGTGEEKAMS